MSHRKRNNQRQKSKNKKNIPASKSPSSEVDQRGEEPLEKGESTKKYVVKHSDIMGRYMEASQDIPEGELILSVEPVVIGPSLNGPEVCLGCYKETNSCYSVERCKKCGWPQCDSRCKGSQKDFGHSKSECDFLKTTKYTPSETALNVIAPLRCLRLKQTDLDKWRTLMQMESHNDIRKTIPSIWETNQTTIVDKIRQEWMLNEFSEEEIHTVCGILEVNAFEVSYENNSARGLYPEAFLFSHDCIPNIAHSNDEKFCFTARTTVPVKRGGVLTTSYAYVLQGTMKRQEHLKESKFFQCRCVRCLDPTEMDTNMSTLICPKCDKNAVLSSDPLNPTALWKCGNKKCEKYSTLGSDVKRCLDRLFIESESIRGDDIEGYEQFLEKYKNLLNPNHYLMIGVKYTLSQLYGKIPDYMIHEMSVPLLQRKIETCQDVLQVANKINPGLSILRGVTLYELHAPMMVLATRDFENSNISKVQLKGQLKKVKSLLTESYNCLRNEPPGTHEGSIGEAAKIALRSLKDWENVLGKF